MAQSATKKLDSGDMLPELQLKITNGTSLNLPNDILNVWSVVLFYRGSW